MSSTATISKECLFITNNNNIVNNDVSSLELLLLADGGHVESTQRQSIVSDECTDAHVESTVLKRKQDVIEENETHVMPKRKKTKEPSHNSVLSSQSNESTNTTTKVSFKVNLTCCETNYGMVECFFQHFMVGYVVSLPGASLSVVCQQCADAVCIIFSSSLNAFF